MGDGLMAWKARRGRATENVLRRAKMLLLILLATWGVAGCSRPPHSQGDRPVVRIGYVPIAVALPLFVAVDNGYFAERGIDVELMRINTSNDLGTAGTLGRVDFMMPCALNVIFDIAELSHARHRLFGLNVYSDQPPNIADYLLVSTASPIKSTSDLKGARIAGHPGSATALVIKLILERYGIGEGDYTFVPLQPAEWGPALTGGSVDAVAALEPTASQLMATGEVRAVVEGFYAKLMPDLPLSGWWVSEAFAKEENKAVVRAVVDGFRDAVAYIEAYPDSAKQHFANYVAISDAALPGMQLNKWLTPETIDVEAVQRMADLFASNGVIQGPVVADSFILRQP